MSVEKHDGIMETLISLGIVISHIESFQRGYSIDIHNSCPIIPLINLGSK